MKKIMNEIKPLSLKEKTELIGWIEKSIEEDGINHDKKRYL